MKARRALAFVWALAGPLGGTALHAEPYAFPRYAGAAQVEAECQRLLADQKATEQRLLESAADGSAAPLALVDTLTLRYEETLGPLGLLSQVHPDKAIRDAADACELGYQDFNNAFFQNDRVLALLKQVQPADAIDRSALRDLVDAFTDAGAALPPEQQARARAINTEITRLGQEFARRLREDHTRVAFSAAELQGVPPGVWRHPPRDAQGRWLLGMDYPTFDPVMERADRGATRERMWRAFFARGGQANLDTLAQMAALRREYAALFGFDSYADFVLRRRMAGNAAAVQAFLTDVKGQVVQREQADLALLRADKAKQLKTPLDSTVIQRWDQSYYIERLRKARYAVDQNQFRRHFPPEASLKFVFGIATRLFGVTFAPVRQATWHADVQVFEVSDVATKEPLGTLFVDLYPRADKYGHAAVFPFRQASTLAQRRPAAALVVNFDRRGLTLDELETLLHEFGHAMHALLSNTRYAMQGGTSVPRDFVEAPSQMLEDWVYDARVLALFRQVCPACAAVPPAQLERAARARHLAKGIWVSRQHLYAGYDMALHGKAAEEPMALWARMEGATPVGHVTGSMFPAGFEHIAGGGYAAGYYGYLWSQVIADDLRTAFAADKLDAAVGRRYREAVLANGSQAEPQQMLQRFLGRPTNSEAFFKWLAIE